MAIYINETKYQMMQVFGSGSPAPVLEEKNATPSDAAQDIAPGDGYDGISIVHLARIPADHVGTGIPRRTSANITVSEETVTVPAGYYAQQEQKSVYTAVQATPGISVSSGGLITASATQSAGYVAAGTKSATQQLSVQNATTVTPGDSEQTVVASGKYTTGAIKVAAVPSATYIKRSETASVSIVDSKPADGTGKTGDLFIKLG